MSPSPRICDKHGLPLGEYGTCNDCEEEIEVEQTSESAEEAFERRLNGE